VRGQPWRPCGRSVHPGIRRLPVAAQAQPDPSDRHGFPAPSPGPRAGRCAWRRAGWCAARRAWRCTRAGEGLAGARRV